MKNKTSLLIIFLLLPFLNTSMVLCLDNHSVNYLVKASPEFCIHGLHLQPNGPFAVMLFDDDAAGTHLGVILYKAGYGDYWGKTKRFWQEEEWAVNVTSFAWSLCGNYLYISTSGIYGTGCLYELNLIEKHFKQIYPKGNNPPPSKSTFTTEIIDIKDEYIEFIIQYFDDLKKKSIRSSEKYKIPIY